MTISTNNSKKIDLNNAVIEIKLPKPNITLSQQTVKNIVLGYGVLVSALYFCPILSRPLKSLYQKYNPAPNQPENITTEAPGFLDSLAPDLARGVVTKDNIYGYQVTSPYLPCLNKTDCRVHPVTGNLSPHLGVDLATPTGTPIYNPTNTTAKLTCLNEPNGAGLYATVTTAKVTFRFFHLSKCNANGKELVLQPYQEIGLTGNTGISTGAHLHFEQKVNGRHIQPQIGYLLAALSGKKPSPILSKNRDYEK